MFYYTSINVVVIGLTYLTFNYGCPSDSYAIMSDAAHMLSDFANLAINFVALYYASGKPRKNYNFGYIRAEALGALFSVMLIWNVAGAILAESIKRLISNEFEIQSKPMIIAGGLAVVFNIFMLFFLRGVPHSHSHGGHSHGGHVRFDNEEGKTSTKCFMYFYLIQ